MLAAREELLGQSAGILYDIMRIQAESLMLSTFSRIRRADLEISLRLYKNASRLPPKF